MSLKNETSLRDEILNVNWLITRNCNLKCSYCKIARMTEENKHIFQNQLNYEKIKQLIRKIYKLNDYCFLSIGGGEPLLAFNSPKKFVSLVRYLNKFKRGYGYWYGFISNSTLLNESLADELVKNNLQNWSTSVDSLDVLEGDRGVKSKSGWYWINYFRERGVPDLQILTVITKENLNQILDMVRETSKRKIWSEITILDFPKNKWYDLATEINYQYAVNDIRKFNKLMDVLYKISSKPKYYIYNLPTQFLFYKKYLYGGYKCKKPWTSLSIDADGRLRLCYRIRGKYVPQYTIDDIFKREDEVLEAFQKDMKEVCEGCNWNCIYQAERALELAKLANEDGFFATSVFSHSDERWKLFEFDKKVGFHG